MVLGVHTDSSQPADHPSVRKRLWPGQIDLVPRRTACPCDEGAPTIAAAMTNSAHVPALTTTLRFTFITPPALGRTSWPTVLGRL